ncbi:hypothetical protein JAAARDRAFT_56395 [Jaapia argillacea MUCL 33604]|uniref:Uncharacterized protein n=1 Tax=Jaapia argillacea MUCL 33604 TaxID=933084 RepID=A0A067Q0P1_9AGAM|nr:hypothetical protein JAAARDRAFT_56395 [Jaapia argillacea MUCL 33604]
MDGPRDGMTSSRCEMGGSKCDVRFRAMRWTVRLMEWTVQLTGSDDIRTTASPKEVESLHLSAPSSTIPLYLQTSRFTLSHTQLSSPPNEFDLGIQDPPLPTSMPHQLGLGVESLWVVRVGVRYRDRVMGWKRRSFLGLTSIVPPPIMHTPTHTPTDRPTKTPAHLFSPGKTSPPSFFARSHTAFFALTQSPSGSPVGWEGR